MPRHFVSVVIALAALGCGAPLPPADAGRDAGSTVPTDAGPRDDRASSVSVATSSSVAEVSSRFLSVAIDSAQVVGGHFWDPDADESEPVGTYRVPPFDFSVPRLRRLAQELAPAYLRIGGTDADKVFVDLSDAPVGEAPEPYEWVMTRAQWDGIHDFIDAVGFELMFTVNGGPGPRAADGSWDPAQARLLMEHSVAGDQRVAVWELGNEPNAFPLVHGLDFRPTAENHVAAFTALRALRDEVDPEARVGGIASAWWPRTGELNPFFPGFVAAGGLAALDVITWHYYPVQSRRCPAMTRRAGPTVMLGPANLAEVDIWAAEVEAARDAHVPDIEVWLGESGGAQCGGEPGVSDRFAGSFWWADQLGRMARRGQPVVVRQTLSGSDYGLLVEESFDPRPDYWLSVLWRRLMGARVLDASSPGDEELMAYAHCTPDGAPDAAPGALTLLLINVTLDQAVVVDLGALGTGARAVYLADGPLYDPTFVLNGEALVAAPDGTLPELSPVRETGGTLRLPQTSIAFVVLPEAGAAACL